MTPEPRGWHRVVVNMWCLPRKEKKENLVSLGENGHEERADFL